MPRFSGKQWFCTWSQCPLEPGLALAQISACLERWGLKDHILAQELHADGGLHLHAYLKTTRKVNTTNSSFLDLRNGSVGTYHGNYQTCRNPAAVKQYVTKDGNWISNFYSGPDEEKRPESVWKLAIEMAKEGKVAKAMAIIAEARPEVFIREANRLRGNLRSLEVRDAKKEDFTFAPVPGIAKWARNTKSLWLEGPSGYGKTEFALSLFERPLLVRHIDALKKLDYERHDGVVFDDMSFKHWPRESCLHLLDLARDSDINCRYCCATLRAGFPRIFTSNVWIWPTGDEATLRRMQYIEVKNDIRVMEAPDEEMELVPPRGPHGYFLFPDGE